MLKKSSLILLCLCFGKIVAQFPITYTTNNQVIGMPYRIENGYDSSLLITGFRDLTTLYNDGEIIKLDANGKKLWHREFKTQILNQAISFTQAKDGGYYVFGTSYLYDTLGDGFICKLNACAEVQWGQILKIPTWNYVTDVFEQANNEILIVQTSNAFRDGPFLYSHVGIYNTNTFKYNKQYLIPTEPLYKKTNKHRNYFYNFNSWSFKDENNPNIIRLGSSQVAYDSTLSHFKIKYFKPFELNTNYVYPYIWTVPVFLESGNMVSGGNLVGLRNDIGYQMSFAKYDKELNLMCYKDMGHIRHQYGAEQVESTNLVADDKMMVGVNYMPNGDYQISRNSQAEFYIVDTNFNELKKITYGDTAKYKYYIHDVIEHYDKNIMVLMHKFKNLGYVAYELAKFDKNLNLVTTNAPSKKYDYKCLKNIDTFGYIDLTNFNTLTMANWNTVAQPTSIQLINNRNTYFNLYPNPSNGVVNIALQTPQTGQIKAYNTLGQILYQTNFEKKDNLQFELSQSVKGIVYITLQTQNYTATKVVVVE